MRFIIIAICFGLMYFSIYALLSDQYLVFGISFIVIVYCVSKIIKLFDEGIRRLNNKFDPSLHLKISIDIEKVVYTDIVKETIMKVFPNEDVEIVIDKMLKNYKVLGNKDNFIEEIEYHIKNNLLRKDDKIDFYDKVYHFIFLRYSPGKYEQTGLMGDEEDYIGLGIQIRVLIVNGMLLLQVGKFSRHNSPNILREGILEAFDVFYTLSSFPIIYLSHKHNMPEKYLNLVYKATKSYKDTFKEKDFHKMYDDRKTINEEVRKYTYLCAEANRDWVSYKKRSKLDTQFKEKAEIILSENGFQNENFYENMDDMNVPEYYYDLVRYKNNYMTILISDFNKLDEFRKEKLYTDFYEASL